MGVLVEIVQPNVSFMHKDSFELKKLVSGMDTPGRYSFRGEVRRKSFNAFFMRLQCVSGITEPSSSPLAAG
jgi:hypothetical protein